MTLELQIPLTISETEKKCPVSANIAETAAPGRRLAKVRGRKTGARIDIAFGISVARGSTTRLTRADAFPQAGYSRGRGCSYQHNRSISTNPRQRYSTLTPRYMGYNCRSGTHHGLKRDVEYARGSADALAGLMEEQSHACMPVALFLCKIIW